MAVRARHTAEFLRARTADKAHEIGNCVLVNSSRVPVGQVGEPFGLGRHGGQLVELGCRE